MPTYYSPYGYLSSAHFTSPDAEVQSSYFESSYGTVSYTRPPLYNYLAFSVRKDGEYQAHATGFSGSDGFPLLYKPSEGHLTTRLSDTDYPQIAVNNLSGEADPHYTDSTAFTTEDDEVIFAFMGNNPEGYLWDFNRNRMHNFEVEYPSFSRPVKADGVVSETGGGVFTFLDTAGNIAFLSQDEQVGVSSSSSSSSRLLHTSSSSSSQTISSSSGKSAISEDYMFDCVFWDKKVISGVHSTNFIDTVSINNITSRTSDSGNLYLCVYTNFSDHLPVQHHIFILRTPRIYPFRRDNIVAAGTSFAPDGLPKTVILQPAGTMPSQIQGQIELNTSSIPVHSTFALIKLTCQTDILESSGSSMSSFMSSSSLSTASQSTASLSSSESRVPCACRLYSLDINLTHSQVSNFVISGMTSANTNGHCVLVLQLASLWGPYGTTFQFTDSIITSNQFWQYVFIRNSTAAILASGYATCSTGGGGSRWLTINFSQVNNSGVSGFIALRYNSSCYPETALGTITCIK